MRAYFFICSALLFIGLADLPMGYFTLLRICICIGAVIALLDEYKTDINFWVIAFGLTAIVFNPIIPIYLGDKQAWIIPDLLAGVLFAIKGFRTKSKTK
jgi:hypothetical protein